jgi:hypothetical protein
VTVGAMPRLLAGQLSGVMSVRPTRSPATPEGDGP